MSVHVIPSRRLVIDIETVPAPLATIEAAMPEHVRSPKIPEELDSPEEPNWAEKCPKYGGDEAKREAWIAERKTRWQSEVEAGREKWRIGSHEARAKFIDDAALDARLGIVKLVGFLAVDENGETAAKTVFFHEPDRARCDLLRDGICEDVAKLVVFFDERAMLRRVFADLQRIHDDMIPGVGNPATKLVSYYGHRFDFPFLYRRGWLNGIPQRPLFQRGRYFVEPMLDLHEFWQMGARDAHTGGLEGLARVLGVPGGKTGDGKSFSKWWEADPVEGVHYLLNDLELTRACAVRMGAL